MAIVAGVDFGTLSVRTSIVDSKRGVLASAAAEYPLHRKRDDPDFATQSHADHMRALAEATRQAVKAAGISGDAGRSDRPRHHRLERRAGRRGHGSDRRLLSVVRPPRQEGGRRDHRAGPPREAAGRSTGAAASIRPNGAGPSCSIGCGTIPTSATGSSRRSSTATWLRRRSPASPTRRQVKRSICAAGHKWLWHADFGGLPPEDFLVKLDPLLKGVRAKLVERLRNLGRDRGSPHAGLGGANSASGPASRFRSAPSTPTGMRSGRASRKATSSMSSAPRPASSPMPARPSWCRGCAAWSRAACTRLSPASKRGCRRSATCSAPSQRAPAPPWRSCRRGSTSTAPARPACCAFRGTTATAPSWSTPTSAGSRSAGTWSTPRRTSCSRRSKAPPFTPASSSTG